jgi:hypothetical protein
MSNAKLEAATHQAVFEVLGHRNADSEGTAQPPAASEATEKAEQTPPAEGAQAEVKPEGDGSIPEATTAAAVEGTGEEPPLTYFGEDLSAFDADERRAIIDMLEKRDDFIGKLLREKSEAEKTVSEEKPEAEHEELTDEAILKALGLDPESNPFDEHTAKVALPLVREVSELKALVSDLLQRDELAETERYWTSELDRLEKAYGELQLSRVAVLEFAANNNIASPEDAYWRLAGPARAQVREVIAQRRAEQEARKRAVASTRPNAVDAEEEPPFESRTAEGQTREAVARALKKLGLG